MERSIKDLVAQAIEDLIVDGKLVVEDNEGNKIEDLSINIVNDNDEEDFDNEDGEEDEEDSSEDDEEDE
jgi:hypothetical protein